MPIVLAALVGLGIGAFGGAQLDDAVEVATGEKDSFPILQIILILGALLFLWRLQKRFSA